MLAESDGVPGAGFLTGFENHQGDARLGPAARPLGRLVSGTGNGDGHTEGAVQGRVVGTYLHGPVLVRNDGLADHLLELVVGELAPFEDEPVRLLREERRAAALAGTAGAAPAAARTADPGQADRARRPPVSSCAPRTTRSWRSEVPRVSLANSTAMMVITEAIVT